MQHRKTWILIATLAIGAINSMAQAETLADFDDFADEFNGNGSRPVFDPLIGYNRVMFQVNDRLYFWLFKPVAKGYGKVVPEPGRLAVKRCFTNILFPVRLVNNLLQLKVKSAGTECARFGINTTVGLLGFFDPAEHRFGLSPSNEDFGQTLGKAGLGGAVPLVLPILGMSNLRDLTGTVADSFLDPLNYIECAKTTAALNGYKQVNNLSMRIGIYEETKKDALDPYIFFRNAYRQRRDKEISE